ncbi:MAG: hypothetical protein Q9195_009417 [Heterodermia aff. obscurata]
MADLPVKLSFLDLPREIRDQIYKYCVAPEDPMYPPPENIMPPVLGPVNLLRACKTVHTEAAPIFYGAKLHIFYIGWRLNWKHSYIHSDIYSDTTTLVAPKYLRMIKSCVLFINPTIGGCCPTTRKTSFLRIKASVQAFANSLSGRHSLKKFQVMYATPEYMAPFRQPLEMFVPTPMPTHIPHRHEENWDPYVWILSDTRIHLLEPLMDIYGIPCVSVSGTRPDIAYRFEQAMTCSQKAVHPKQESFKTRMVKVKGQRGKKKVQAYRVSKYYESKIIWNMDLLGPLPAFPKLIPYT